MPSLSEPTLESLCSAMTVPASAPTRFLSELSTAARVPRMGRVIESMIPETVGFVV
jgi:hypothetical protein